MNFRNRLEIELCHITVSQCMYLPFISLQVDSNAGDISLVNLNTVIPFVDSKYALIQMFLSHWSIQMLVISLVDTDAVIVESSFS